MNLEQPATHTYIYRYTCTHSVRGCWLNAHLMILLRNELMIRHQDGIFQTVLVYMSSPLKSVSQHAEAQLLDVYAV